VGDGALSSRFKYIFFLTPELKEKREIDKLILCQPISRMENFRNFIDRRNKAEPPKLMQQRLRFAKAPRERG
jgi:hypothetical protein